MSRHELSDDILLMSTALKGKILVKPSESAPKSTTASEIFQAFATILTITTPNEFSASNVLAVTGIVNPDSIKTLVVTRIKERNGSMFRAGQHQLSELNIQLS